MLSPRPHFRVGRAAARVLAASLLVVAAARGQPVDPPTRDRASDQEADAKTSHAEQKETQDDGAPSLETTIDRAVRKIEDERREQCRDADAKAVPCFPISVEADRRERLNQALARLRKNNPDVGHGVIPEDPLAPARPTPVPAANVVSFDPGCAVKALIKGFKGENQHFYLYRVKGVMGESIALRERPLTPAGDEKRAPLEFKLLGEYDGECEAVAAHAKALRELLEEKSKKDAEAVVEKPAAPTPEPQPGGRADD